MGEAREAAPLAVPSVPGPGGKPGSTGAVRKHLQLSAGDREPRFVLGPTLGEGVIRMCLRPF